MITLAICCLVSVGIIMAGLGYYRMGHFNYLEEHATGRLVFVAGIVLFLIGSGLSLLFMT